MLKKNIKNVFTKKCTYKKYDGGKITRKIRHDKFK